MLHHRSFEGDVVLWNAADVLTKANCCSVCRGLWDAGRRWRVLSPGTVTWILTWLFSGWWYLFYIVYFHDPVNVLTCQDELKYVGILCTRIYFFHSSIYLFSFICLSINFSFISLSIFYSSVYLCIYLFVYLSESCCILRRELECSYCLKGNITTFLLYLILLIYSF